MLAQAERWEQALKEEAADRQGAQQGEAHSAIEGVAARTEQAPLQFMARPFLAGSLTTMPMNDLWANHDPPMLRQRRAYCRQYAPASPGYPSSAQSWRRREMSGSRATSEPCVHVMVVQEQYAQ